MTSEEILTIAGEVAHLTGRVASSIFSLSNRALAISLVPSDGRFIYLDTNSAKPQLFVIARKLKTLVESARRPTPLARELQAQIAGSRLISVDSDDRSILLTFEAAGGGKKVLAVDLSPRERAADLPNPPVLEIHEGDELLAAGSRRHHPRRDVQSLPLSEEFDRALREGLRKAEFDELARKARAGIDREVKRIERLIQNLHDDDARHGDPEKWKMTGDLILTNLSSLSVESGQLKMTDLFHPDMPTITLPIEANQTPAQLAEDYFRRYSKARNARSIIAKRLARASERLEQLQKEREVLDQAIEARDANALERFISGPAKPANERKKTTEKLKGIRTFISGEGFEILVGKKSQDNDFLTFRVARSRDLWLHAADYPGSHVVIRLDKGKAVPNRTLIAAARIAAFYSQAKTLPKAAVNYTERKYVRKPRKAAPGLVSLGSFRTILVEPTFPEDVTRHPD